MHNKTRFLSLLFIGMFNISTAHAFQDAYGNPIVWEDKWKIINYWAEWCGPCRREIPEFNQLAEELNNEQILVVGVNFDNLSSENIIQALVNLDINFPVLDPISLKKINLPQPVVLPTTYILTPDGNIVSTLVGEQTQNSIRNSLYKSKNSILERN